MEISGYRSTVPLNGRCPVPGDKSISHRALILSALARGTTRVSGLLTAADCLATRQCIKALGVTVRRDGDDWLIHGRGARLQPPTAPLNCERSGTTMRLLAGVAAAQDFTCVLDGAPQLRRRPMERIAVPLRRMGATISTTDGGAPLHITGGRLKGVDYTLPVASAQVKSAVLLAGLQAEGPTTVRQAGLSRDHTERMLAAMGATMTRQADEVRLDPGPLTALGILSVPGDISSAAFPLAAALLIPGSDITLSRVGVNPTRTGFLTAVRRMGADIALVPLAADTVEPTADIRVRAGGLRATTLAGTMIPTLIDELPLLALLATQADGETRIRDADELRVKESDRISGTAAELSRLGACITPQRDGWIIQGPTRLKGTAVDARGDHRLAMCLCIAGLVADGRTRIRGAECIGDSFPGFVALMNRLGAGFVVTEGGIDDRRESIFP